MWKSYPVEIEDKIMSLVLNQPPDGSRNVTDNVGVIVNRRGSKTSLVLHRFLFNRFFIIYF